MHYHYAPVHHPACHDHDHNGACRDEHNHVRACTIDHRDINDRTYADDAGIQHDTATDDDNGDPPADDAWLDYDNGFTVYDPAGNVYFQCSLRTFIDNLKYVTAIRNLDAAWLHDFDVAGDSDSSAHDPATDSVTYHSTANTGDSPTNDSASDLLTEQDNGQD